MKKIKIAFSDFGNRFNPKSFFVYKILKKHYDIEIVEKNPDILVYSCYGTQFLKHEDAKRIFWTGENILPNFNQCDYSISFLRNNFNGRNLYFPLALSYISNKNFSNLLSVDKKLAERKFCSFIASQENNGEGAYLRKLFCQKLMECYKKVDCPGRVLHNCDDLILSDRDNELDWHSSKLKYLSKYKFNIAFENSNTDGYITEKLVDPFMCNCVPIYWGSTGNLAPFSKKALIYANDFVNLEDLIEYIKYVDQNDDVYLNYINNNPLKSCDFYQAYENELEQFLIRVVETPGRIQRDPLHLDPLYEVKNFALMSHAWRRRLYNIYQFYMKLKRLLFKEKK